ncbi:SdpI family protein [Cucumibacter marinus]|uniref:SdpI family protein n=1 Tax=Cucumibacter marinus TaxID=1121252 RepID=UPI0004055AAB|nr:SdpI family protein [Cucumibacter marinus]
MISRLFAGPVHLALSVMLLALTIVAYLGVPLAMPLPIHWTITGEVDGYLPALWAFLPALLLGIASMALWALGPGLGGGEHFERGKSLIAVAACIVTGAALVLQSALLAIGFGVAVDMVRIATIGIAIAAIVLGNYLPKTQPNALAGLRLPPTLSDAQNWTRTHRLTGRLMMLGGTVSLILAVGLANQPYILIIVLAVALLLPTIAGTIYSYRIRKSA